MFILLFIQKLKCEAMLHINMHVYVIKRNCIDIQIYIKLHCKVGMCP